MTVTYGDAKRWQSAPLGTAGDSLKKDLDALEGARDLLETQGVPASWTGLAVTGDGAVAGHAALRALHGTVELKRMYVDPAHRGLGVAGALLEAAHDAARARGHRTVLLQTGDRQPGAVRLYERAGYHRVPIFSPYEPVTFSVCMALDLP